MADTFEIDQGNKRAIKASQKAYDSLDKRERIANRREETADQLYEGIKSYKKRIKGALKKEIEHQMQLAESQANGEEVDPESMLSQEELLMMVGEASFMIDTLEQHEEELVRFKMGQTKSIKCPYC